MGSGGSDCRSTFRSAPAVNVGGADSGAFQWWTAEQIAEVCATPRSVGAIRECWPLVHFELLARGQASRASCAAALGTLAIETASTFRPVREAYWVYDKDPAAAYRYYSDTSQHAAYSGGPEFHGRGFIQTTHDYNYDRVGYRDNPDALMQPGPAAQAFAVYWTDRDIQAMADRHDWRAVRRAVQGGSNGLDRLIQIADGLLSL